MAEQALQRYSEATKRSVGNVDESIINYELLEHLVAHICRTEAAEGPSAFLPVSYSGSGRAEAPGGDAKAGKGGAVLVSADAGGSLRVWDLMTGECTRQLRSASEVTSLWAAPSGLLLAAASDGTLVLWRAQDGVSSATACVPGGGLAAVHQLGGFHHALALCLDGRLRVLAARDGTPLLQLGGVEGVTAVEVTGNRPSAPAGGHDARSRCGPMRVRDRLWCFAGGNRLC